MSEKPKLSQDKQIDAQLVDAEKRAKQTIKDARMRAKRLLQTAPAEAAKEVQRYQQARKEEFKNLDTELKAKLQGDTVKMEKDVQALLQMINTLVEKNRGKVIDLLMEAVLDIAPQIEPNFVLRRQIEKACAAAKSTPESNSARFASSDVSMKSQAT